MFTQVNDQYWSSFTSSLKDTSEGEKYNHERLERLKDTFDYNRIYNVIYLTKKLEILFFLFTIFSDKKIGCSTQLITRKPYHTYDRNGEYNKQN